LIQGKVQDDSSRKFQIFFFRISEGGIHVEEEDWFYRAGEDG
jgi:hypothetical protein